MNLNYYSKTISNLTQTLTLTLNLPLYSLYYAEACDEFSGPFSTSLRLRTTQLRLFEETATVASRWQQTLCAILTGPRFEPKTSRSKQERATD